MYPKLKLVYFPFNGRVAATRLAFVLGDIPFVDEIIPYCDGFAQTPQAAAYPYRMLPVLEVDGQPIAESMAMLRYAGSLAGLYPANDPLGCLLIDEVLELVEVFTDRCLRWEREGDAANQQILREELLEVIIPSHFAAIDAKLAALATHPTFAADTSKIFIHDLVLRSFVEYIIWDKFLPDMAVYPHWKSAVDKVNNHPKVKQYYALQALREAAEKTPYKLTGADSSVAQCESIRLAFRIGGVSFVDDRIDPKTCEADPVLRTPDGRTVSSTIAILRFVGSIAGLYPGAIDPLVSLRVDELLGQIEELQNHWYYPAYTAADGDKRRKHREAVVSKTIPKFLADLDRRVGQWASPYATGPSFTVADLAIAGVLAQVSSGAFLPDNSGSAEPVAVPVDSYINLLKIQSLVQNHPALQ